MSRSRASDAALAAWLVRQRWYATPAEGGEARGAAPRLRTVDLPGTSVAIGLADTPGGERYQLLVDHDGTAADAATDPDAVAALVRFVTTEGTAGGAGDPTVRGHWLASATPVGDAVARPFGGEQSNTSVIVGGTHVLKLLRRVRSGVHPELEIGRHLAAVAADGTAPGPVPVAPLAGWYDLHEAAGTDGPAGEGDSTTVLGVIQALVPGALDGWTLILSSLAADPGEVLSRLHALGEAIANLHGALAVPSATSAAPQPGDAAHGSIDPSAFGTAPFDTDRLTGVVDGVARQSARLLDGTTDLATQPDLAVVAGRHGEVADLARQLADAVGHDAGCAIRHHGDLHLGQTILGADGWVILDFEGEPNRPLAERRAHHSPLRDVAGMLRSFAYAATTQGRAHGTHLPQGWEPAARAAFLDGYLSHVDPALLPASAAATARLLALLELEKVVYEIGYEVAHRPDWVVLPVTGLRRMLEEAQP